jgi:hypothetical protein
MFKYRYKMRKIALLLFAIIAISESSFAKIRRVGFFASPISGTDYSTFALAYAAAVAGDTVLMFPATSVGAVISKKLTIIGPGNFLDPTSVPKGNAGQQAFAGEATIGVITLAAGSDGTVITGLRTGSIFILASNISIVRNRDLTVYVAYSNTAATINNIQVIQNFSLTFNNYYVNASSVTNINVSNNLINSFSTASGNTYSGNISNNVWAYDATQNTANANGGTGSFSTNSSIDLGGGAYLLQNNIFEAYSANTAPLNYNYFSFANGGNSVFNYNLALQTGSGPAQLFGVGTGNIITPITNNASIFAAFPLLGSSSVDARFQLAVGSPALTIGAGGTPIGMFTGTSPYKLSTIPAIPTIYSLSSPQGNNPLGSTIQLNVSTRGNN